MKVTGNATKITAIIGAAVVVVLTVVMCTVIAAYTKGMTYQVGFVVSCAAMGAIQLALIILVGFIQVKSRRLLEQMALVDPVTKGYSRARFDSEMETLMKKTPEGTYSLVSVDVQRFKLINDLYGDSVGNTILQVVYDTILSELRSGEIICRSFSDRFYILMFAETREQIAARLKKIADKINEYDLDDNEKYYIPLVFGVYRLTDKRQSIILAADRANVARRSVKGSALHQDLCTIGYYNDDERIRMLNEKYMYDRMNYALKNGEFKVYLQPKNALAGQKTMGAEALVRWNDPEKGMLSPGKFIPMFEHNGFVVKLDLFVFETVLKIMTGWQQSGKKLIPVSVNLSRAHLVSTNFFDSFLSVFERYNIPAKYIEFEFTETLFVENLELLRQVIRNIHKHGFTCSMDDFGSGYSSLNTLKDVEVDALKLDGAFFGGTASKRAQTVIEAVVQLANKLNMQTVAEGVETQRQFDFLKSVGCTLVQGYICSPPLPPDEFEKYAF